MNPEQKNFHKVIKARRNRASRLKRPMVTKSYVNPYKDFPSNNKPKKLSLWERIVKWWYDSTHG